MVNMRQLATSYISSGSAEFDAVQKQILIWEFRTQIQGTVTPVYVQ